MARWRAMLMFEGSSSAFSHGPGATPCRSAPGELLELVGRDALSKRHCG